MFYQDGALAHHSYYTVTYMRSHVPEFVELENWPPDSLDLNLYGLFRVWSICELSSDQMKFMLIDCWTQLCQGTLN